MPIHDSEQTGQASPLLRKPLLFALFALAAASPAIGLADGEVPELTAGRDPYRATQQQRPFGFLADPSTPSAGVVSMSYGFGIGSGISAERPIPVSLAATNGSHTMTIGYGLTQRWAPFASATFAEAAAHPGRVGSTVSAGATVQLTRPDAPLRVALTGAGFHEGLSGASGVSVLAAGSLDFSRLRVALNVRADRAFAAGRDRVDLFTMAGVSYRLSSVLRVGAEYIGQDLEEIGGDAAEGGARHAAGPNLALDLLGGRYQLAVASGFGLSARSPHALVRAALATNF